MEQKCVGDGNEQRLVGTTEPPTWTALSERETQVLSFLTEGLSNKEIARKLEISEATVKVHVKSLLRKIRAKNRTAAAVWAQMSGFMNGSDAALPAAEVSAGPSLPLEISPIAHEHEKPGAAILSAVPTSETEQLMHLLSRCPEQLFDERLIEDVLGFLSAMRAFFRKSEEYVGKRVANIMDEAAALWRHVPGAAVTREVRLPEGLIEPPLLSASVLEDQSPSGTVNGVVMPRRLCETKYVSG